MIGFLILLIALGHLLPGVLAALFNHSQAAWESVGYGIESGGLWAYVSGKRDLALPGQQTTFSLLCLWGYFESLQRPICRLAFPMDRPPKLLPNQNLCDAATGLPLTYLSLLLALFVASLLQEVGKNGESR